MTPNPLIGTWRLISYESRTGDGEVSYPLGPNPSGFILYSEDGYMSVTMMSANRTNYASGDLRGGTDEEKRSAAETYLSYSGKYTFEGDRVLHHVEVSFFPNRVGTTQVRNLTLSGDTVTLRTPAMLINGKQQRAELLWQRAEAGNA